VIRLAGEISLLLSLLFSLTQSVIPLWGYWRNNPYALSFARSSAFLQCIFILIAYALLTIAFGISDFSIAYVAANSHPSLPMMYRLTAVWGAHEGSILLWVVILNIWTIIFSIVSKKISHSRLETLQHTLTLAILGCISFCFLCFILLTSNPFTASLVIQTGRDLNPLLQDPGFVIHPPMLYMGYVGFSVAYAITQAALITNQLNKAWANITRLFSLAAFCFLTFGIMLGSWWAYRVLGWGGFWFWDPVENASLLPWISGTALIHVLILSERSDSLKAWAALLAIISFALSLLGTFLVRSGVLVSVHTFASDPARGLFLLILLAILITAALIIYVLRLPSLSSKVISFSWLSREMALLFNSALLMIAMMTILLGTLYPLIFDALHLGNISVGAPYFNTVMMPLVFIIMASMGIGVLLPWGQQTIKKCWKIAWKKIAISVIAAMVLLWGVTGTLEIITFISLTLSIWIILSVLPTARFNPGMAFTHSGFAILIIGIMLSSVLNQEKNIQLSVHDQISIGPYQFYFLKTNGINGPNYHGIQAEFEVTKGRRHIAHLYPEKRIYTVRDMVMTKIDIHPGIFRDLYIALGEPLSNDSWSVRIYYKPFIRWIWFGGLLMIIGSILAILNGKKIK